MKYLIAAFLFSTVMLVNVTLGKSVRVKGTVLAFNEFPLQGVKISTKKSETVTYTDVNGTFEIEIEQRTY